MQGLARRGERESLCKASAALKKTNNDLGWSRIKAAHWGRLVPPLTPGCTATMCTQAALQSTSIMYFNLTCSQGLRGVSELKNRDPDAGGAGATLDY